MSDENDLDELPLGPYRTPAKPVEEPASYWPRVETATGSFLDALGENVDVDRFVIVPTRMTAPEIAEPDSEYRDRIRDAYSVPARRVHDW